jgi:hypothetical protein
VMPSSSATAFRCETYSGWRTAIAIDWAKRTDSTTVRTTASTSHSEIGSVMSIETESTSRISTGTETPSASTTDSQ